MAAQVEAGTIELTVRDIGGIDLAVGEYARTQNVGREAARQAIIENLRTSSAIGGRRQSRSASGR